jgi:hypothetical protein
MEEIYIIIQEFPNYQISNLGNVRNIQTGKILKPNIGTTGYYFVNLYLEGKAKSIKIHRLVAKYFIPNLNNKKEIDHIDNNTLNNNISNLRWCNRSENNKNKDKKEGCTSKFLGVSYVKRNGKWRARIKRGGKTSHIGTFETELEASQARDNYIINNNLMDEFTKLNKDIQ